MDFRYEVTITDSKNNTIEFKFDEENKNDAITGVRFGFNSDDATRERDRNGRIEITVFGKFDGTDKTLTAIKGTADWAKSKDDVYREVTIVLKTEENSGSENFVRTYHFDKMFCIDYYENTGIAIENGDTVGLEFRLFMAQAPTYKKHDALFDKSTESEK
jgi:hypothetical protein